MPGLLMALHTWGRTLSRHPHVHCLVSAGGIDGAGQWQASHGDFLVPLRPLQILFRGKLFDFIGIQLAVCDAQIETQLQSLQSHDGEPAKGKKRGRARNAPKFDLRTQLFKMCGVDLTRIDGIDVTTRPTTRCRDAGPCKS